MPTLKEGSVLVRDADIEEISVDSVVTEAGLSTDIGSSDCPTTESLLGIGSFDATIVRAALSFSSSVIGAGGESFWLVRLTAWGFGVANQPIPKNQVIAVPISNKNTVNAAADFSTFAVREVFRSDPVSRSNSSSSTSSFESSF